jgi:hypothetical protein
MALVTALVRLEKSEQAFAQELWVALSERAQE